MMRYTRYDLKNKNKKKHHYISVVFVLMLVLAIILGTIVSKFTIKGAAPQKTEANTNSSSKPIKFAAIQGGLYANIDNANKEKDVLASFGNPFMIKEGDRNRVFLGIYSEDSFDNIIKTLNEKGKSNSKMVFTLNKNNLCDAEIAEIISANIKILQKLTESDVRAVKTQDLKTWATALKKADDSSKNIKELNELKDYIGKLPTELTKDKAADNYVFLYNILKNISEISK